MAWMKGAAAVCVLLLFTLCSGDKLQIKTQSGVVKGHAVITPDGKQVNEFLGIPYAAPPTGANRFVPPKEVEPWQKVFEASSFSASCHQLVTDELKKKVNWISENVESEDCLKLNLWVPKHRPKNSTVMVFIHGGGFASGSTDIPLYNGAILAAQENIIIASVNYRVSLFGFLYLGHPDVPGNVGLMDQAAGLKWIKNNIQYFGGDPDKVTIFGESAGSACVGFHLVIPSSSELFRNAILQSGTANAEWATAQPEFVFENTLQLAKQVGCPDQKDKPVEILQCLQKKSVAELMQVAFKMEARPLSMNFKPMIDGTYLPSSPSDLLSRGQFCNKKNIMVGLTREDGALFLTVHSDTQLNEDTVYTESDFRAFIDSLTHYHKRSTPLEIEIIKDHYTDWDATDDKFSVRTQILHFATDRFFGCPSLSFADHVVENGNNLYMFRFDQVPEYREDQPPLPRWIGSTHADELYYIFGLKVKQDPPASSEEVRFAKQVMRYWANFAKNNDPNDEFLPLWPKYSKTEKLRLHLDDKEITANKVDRLRECSFWEHTFPKIKLLSKDEL